MKGAVSVKVSTFTNEVASLMKNEVGASHLMKPSLRD